MEVDDLGESVESQECKAQKLPSSIEQATKGLRCDNLIGKSKKQAKNFEKTELILAPTCSTQNFQCNYQLEVSLRHNGFMSNTTDLDFEVYLQNADLHKFMFEQISQNQRLVQSS
jgi:hypothetical protein